MVKIAEYDFDWATIHKSYLTGKTLVDIAIENNCSQPCVARNFKKRNLKVLSLAEAGLRSKRLKRGTTGRTRPTKKINGKRVQLSHYNWCIANTFPIVPKGMVIHHIDNNRHNNETENLVMLPRETHLALHYKQKLILNENRKFWGINSNKGGI